MKPVYATERATLYHARAEDVLPVLDTESVDLVVTDPPYGQEWQSGRRVQKFETLHGDESCGDARAVIRTVLTECVRLVGQQRHLYVFGPTDVLDGMKVSEPTSLVWDKGVMSGGDLSKPWGNAHEPISFVVSKHRHGGKAGSPSLAARMRKGSVIHAYRPTGRKVRHPSEKPLTLLSELIESSSRIGELVLDPFAGIASTGVAALLLGRRAILIESDKRWIPLAIARLSKAEKLAEQMVTI